MPITLNPSQLFVGADGPAKTNVNIAAAARAGSKSPESRSEFQESLSRAKSKSAGAADHRSRPDGATTDRKIAKATKSSKRRPQRTDDKPVKPADEDVRAESAEAASDTKNAQ